MKAIRYLQKSSAGFALILVLASLLILTTLFAIIQTRSLNYRFWAGTEQTILTNQLYNHEALRLAISLRIANPSETIFDLGDGKKIVLQDVGGLIDLNTAAPELLDRLANDIGVTPNGLRRYHEWRAAGHRLMRVADFLRVTGAPDTAEPRLFAAATVFSGRSGIAPDVANLSALQIATGQVGSVVFLARSLPLKFRSEASGTNFEVALVTEKVPDPVIIGIVNVGQTEDTSRILETR